jgi:hypothetical protein
LPKPNLKRRAGAPAELLIRPGHVQAAAGLAVGLGRIPHDLASKAGEEKIHHGGTEGTEKAKTITMLVRSGCAPD